MVFKVRKRDGQIEDFECSKVKNAITKAFVATRGDNLGAAEKNKITAIVMSIYDLDKDILDVEDIQDMIEDKLNASKKYRDVGKAYVIYRHNRSLVREMSTDFIKKVISKVDATDVENSNANVNEHSFSGREKEASTALGKHIAVDLNGLPGDIAKAHKDMLLYQHDLEKAIYGVHNCLFVDIPELFTNGFRTRNGDVRPPKTFSAACQQLAVIFQCQSQVC